MTTILFLTTFKLVSRKQPQLDFDVEYARGVMPYFRIILIAKLSKLIQMKHAIKVLKLELGRLYNDPDTEFTEKELKEREIAGGRNNQINEVIDAIHAIEILNTPDDVKYETMKKLQDAIRNNGINKQASIESDADQEQY